MSKELDDLVKNCVKMVIEIEAATLIESGLTQEEALNWVLNDPKIKQLLGTL